MPKPFTPHKRILIFCDGTNQDGLVASMWCSLAVAFAAANLSGLAADDGTAFEGDVPLYYTNVLRLCAHALVYSIVEY